MAMEYQAHYQALASWRTYEISAPVAVHRATSEDVVPAGAAASGLGEPGAGGGICDTFVAKDMALYQGDRDVARAAEAAVPRAR
jgi:hypothetical protein